jgi:hypothetical protein
MHWLVDRPRGGIVAAAIAATLGGCGDNWSVAAAPELADRAAFVEKAHHALRPGTPALTPDELDAFLAMSDEAIVRQMLADPRSDRGIAALALHFLGAPVDRIRDPSGWSLDAMAYWPVAAAVRAYHRGEDPLAALKELRAIPPVGAIAPPDAATVRYYFPDDTFTPASGGPAYRAQVDAAIRARFDAARDRLLQEPLDQSAFCDQFRQVVDGVIFYPSFMGGPQGLGWDLRHLATSTESFNALNDACYSDPRAPLDRAVAVATVAEMRAFYEALHARIEAFTRSVEASPDLALDPIDPVAVGLVTGEYFGTPSNELYDRFWTEAPVSSTNFNRRRGAYVLDRFFCDDLRPVGAALPPSHGGDQHASDPACRACHFKLDPMAGFFRRHGVGGHEFSDELLASYRGEIFFDDFERRDFVEYDATWSDSTGTRPYNVGYIRSTRDDSLNSYGSDLRDLSRIIQSAPEVDRCFVQRMFEHYNGADQAVDPGFLDQVAVELRTQGVKHAVTRIVAGETFRRAERNTTVCYDLAAGAEDQAGRPPCAVAAVLQTYCASCHASATAQAGLDLTAWQAVDRGMRGFPHVDPNGVPIPPAETLARMLDRLKTADPARQMPMSREMPLHVREALVVWVQDQLDAIGGAR